MEDAWHANVDRALAFEHGHVLHLPPHQAEELELERLRLFGLVRRLPTRPHRHYKVEPPGLERDHQQARRVQHERLPWRLAAADVQRRAPAGGGGPRGDGRDDGTRAVKAPPVGLTGRREPLVRKYLVDHCEQVDSWHRLQ